MSEWLTELRAAHDELAALLGTDSGYDAWDRLSALIQEGPPVSALDALPEIGDESDLSVGEQRTEVLRALYEAATLTAVLKWLDIHRGEFDEPGAPAAACEDDKPEAEMETRSRSGMIGELEDAFSG
jgi:hypothetical protein